MKNESLRKTLTQFLLQEYKKTHHLAELAKIFHEPVLPSEFANYPPEEVRRYAHFVLSELASKLD